MSNQKHRQSRRKSWLGAAPLACASGFLALGLALSRPARAQQAEANRAWHWYGWQTLSTDGAGVSLFVMSAGASAHSDRAATALAYAGVTTLALGGPIVHAAHGRLGAAAGSLALRVGLPVLGLLALDLDQSSCSECGQDYLLALFALTAPVALDAAALSWERTEAPYALSRIRVRPYASVRRKQFNAGLVATF